MAHHGVLEAREGREAIAGAEGDLPDVSGLAIDGVAVEGDVRAGSGRLANDAEAGVAGDEGSAGVHAVELDIGVAEIDVVVASDEAGDLAGLTHTEPMVGRRSRGAGVGSEGGGQAESQRQSDENSAAHVSSITTGTREMARV